MYIFLEQGINLEYRLTSLEVPHSPSQERTSLNHDR